MAGKDIRFDYAVELIRDGVLLKIDVTAGKFDFYNYFVNDIPDPKAAKALNATMSLILYVIVRSYSKMLRDEEKKKEPEKISPAELTDLMFTFGNVLLSGRGSNIFNHMGLNIPVDLYRWDNAPMDFANILVGNVPVIGKVIQSRETEGCAEPVNYICRYLFERTVSYHVLKYIVDGDKMDIEKREIEMNILGLSPITADDIDRWVTNIWNRNLISN